MLKNKTAIVTGSTSGIGYGIATMLAKSGCNIMLNGFADDATLANIKKEISAFGVKVGYSSADMRNAGQIEDMVKQTEKELGSVDILVNNAGIQRVFAIDQFPDDAWDDVIAINLSSSFHTIKHALPLMRKRNWGRIINIASAHGLVASEHKAAYVAAKHGIVGLTKVVGLETAEEDITCNAICPGWVLTPLVDKQISDNAAAQKISYEQAKHNLLSEKQPSLKFVMPEHIGEMVLFLCSDAASQIKGVALPIDGGWVAR